MKDKIEIIVITLAFALVAVRLYQKYFRKDPGQKSSGKKSSSSFSSSTRYDDYEPYSKK